MRKLAAILLLACLYFTFSGYHFLFRYRISKAKTEMRSFLRSQKHHKDVIELSFTHEELNQLNWEDDHEFRYRGEMFDVIEKRTEGDKTVIRCISDKKETALLDQYQKAIQKSNRNNRHASSIVKLITSYFILSPFDSPQQPEELLKRTFPVFSSDLHDLSLSKFSPPPKFC